MRVVMHEHIDIDPGEAPRMRDCDVPAELSDEERPYVGRLVTVFAEASGIAYRDRDQVAADKQYGPQMTLARRRYRERDGCRRHFRDNLPAAQIDAVDDGVHAMVIDRYHVTDALAWIAEATAATRAASPAQYCRQSLESQPRRPADRDQLLPHPLPRGGRPLLRAIW